MRRLALLAGLLLLALTVGPVAAGSPAPSSPSDASLTADLEGEPIELTEVGRYHCHDLDYPAIHCFRSPKALSDAVTGDGLLRLLSGVDYVMVWDGSGYSGSSLILSQDYDVLAVIGWNDRISSFKGRGLQTGTFHTDWFGGGSSYAFCCNQQVPNLGGYSNTFSSVYND